VTEIRDIALPQPGRVGQATAIEQSRAVAEVYAAIMVAQQVPRNVDAALQAMEEACTTTELADRAFFSFPRGGSKITGPTVYLARELARCWGNIQYGVAELRRDDEHGQSEMQAFAWDVQTNARAATIFIVPHMRDKKGGPERLTDMRDIYESNANAGARRVRECIFSVLPAWFVERAKTRCVKTLQDGGGKPLAIQVAEAVSSFQAIGVTKNDLERRVGRGTAEWTPLELGTLRVVYSELSRGETTREEAFPAPVVTTAEIPKPAARPPAEVVPDQADDYEHWHATGHQAAGNPARQAFDPACDICTVRDKADEGRVHYYNHTEDFVDGCEWCDQDKAWKAEASNG